MIVREAFTEIVVDKKTGKRTERHGSRMVDMPGVISEAEALKIERQAAVEAERQAIRDQLAANDVTALRALFEGDQDRLRAHAAAQAELRQKLAGLAGSGA